MHPKVLKYTVVVLWLEFIQKVSPKGNLEELLLQRVQVSFSFAERLVLFTDLILHQVLNLLEKINFVHGVKFLTVVGQFVGAVLLFEGVVLEHCLSLSNRPRLNRTSGLFLEVDCSILKDHLTLPGKSQVELLPP